jgi:hypothetical protein
MNSRDLHPLPVTPRMTAHARERCQQMGIRTRDAKRVWQHRTVTRGMSGQKTDRVLATSTEYPDYAVVVDINGWYDDGGSPVIITVLFNVDEKYERDGNGGYTIVEEGTDG